ncbi:MAG: 4-alpha-glucanotransferase, partial [Actinomycetota bacterium]|nr:4-alpha-glucanotransferase [Actinomycetota bacterium]
MADEPRGDLVELAALYGVQTAYRDVFDRVRQASATSVLATLRALGAPVDGPDDVPDAVHLRCQELWGRMLEPVVASFERSSVPVSLRLPLRSAGRRLTCHLTVEGGEPHTWTQDLGALRPTERADVAGTPHVGLELLVGDLPYGYHRLVVELDGDRGAGGAGGRDPVAETLLVVAPPRAYPPQQRRAWGAFLP